MKKMIILSAGAIILSACAAGTGQNNMFMPVAPTATPTTINEACNKDDIARICPEMLFGQKTLVQCLNDNITQLTTKCSNFVTQSVNNKITATTGAMGDPSGTDSAAKIAETQAKVDATRAAGQQTVDSAKATGDALKGLFQ